MGKATRNVSEILADESVEPAYEHQVEEIREVDPDVNYVPEVVEATEARQDAPPEAVEAPSEAEVTEAVQEVATPQPLQEKQYVNAAARARILERDNRVLQDRLNALVNAISVQQQQPQVQQQVQSEPDIQEDPVGALYHEIKTIKAKLEENERVQMQRAQAGSVQSKLAYADNMIRQFAAQDPAQFNEATTYLAKIVQEQMEEEYPDATEDERLGMVAQTIAQQKLKWVQEGKNPGLEYYKRAKRFGFHWEGPKPVTPAQAAATAEVDARAQIKAEKAKDQKAASLGKTVGAPPKRGRDVAKMSENEFHTWLSTAVKSGEMRVEPGRTGKTPKFSDLLPGVGIALK